MRRASVKDAYQVAARDACQLSVMKAYLRGERSDAIHFANPGKMDCFASLAMTWMEP